MMVGGGLANYLPPYILRKLHTELVRAQLPEIHVDKLLCDIRCKLCITFSRIR